MLESEEGQLNAVFACFGSAVQHAQKFEQALERFLQTYNRIYSESLGVEEIGDRMTMGMLLGRVRKHVTITGGSLAEGFSITVTAPRASADIQESHDNSIISEGFSVALKERNFLIHRFFLERDSKLGYTEGRMQLIEELVRTESNLHLSRIAINAVRIALCEAVEIEDEWAQDYSS